MIQKNTASQFLHFALIDASDGSAHTGQTPTGYVTIDSGAQAGIGGSIAENGNGQYELALSQGDTNGDSIGYLIVNSGSIPVSLTVTTETKKMADLNDLAAGAEMDLIDDAITSDKYDESSAFALEAADTGSSQVARVGADGDTLESLSDEIAALPTDADVIVSAGTALSNIHLDHLLAVTYDPTAQPGVADALLNELIENDSGVSRYTANALEQAPGAAGDATEAKQDEILVDLVDIKGTAFAKDTNSLVNVALPGDLMGLANDAITSAKYDESSAFPLAAADTGATEVARTGADGDTLEDISDEIAAIPDAAGIQSECNDALVALHLDHLFAVAYAGEGTAGSLLLDLTEDDAGTFRFTENALEEAPSGTGGDATEAKQDEILVDLVDIKGTAFAKDTDSLINLAHTGADSDTLEDISDEIAAVASSLGTTDGKVDDIDTVVDLLMDIAEGDHEIDDSGSPLLHVIKRKSTATVLVSKELYELDDTAVDAVTQVVSKELEA